MKTINVIACVGSLLPHRSAMLSPGLCQTAVSHCSVMLYHAPALHHAHSLTIRVHVVARHLGRGETLPEGVQVEAMGVQPGES